MQIFLRSICSGFLLFGHFLSNAQTAADYSIQLQAAVQTSPPAITLRWKKVASATAYTVSRKSLQAAAWTTLFNGTASDTVYADAAVVADSAYEYRVAATGGAAGTGYLYGGIRSKPIHSRGTVLLLVDSLLRDSCAVRIEELRSDLRADGYAVITRTVKRTDDVTTVKALITGIYAGDPTLGTLLLLGHIPVPYSGNIFPDGHADHQGAWPADSYYGDMDGMWTDVSVNNTVASRPQNDNIPGDGKWDQNILPTTAELAIGRVDFANMPAFGKSESTMMNSYLARAHEYKSDLLAIRKRGLIDDNFGAFNGEAFAANAWRAYPPLLGRDSITSADYMTTLDTASYQWAFGCGGGTYTSAGGIGTTANLSSRNVNGIFTMMFGSYFGDWDAQDNFLRAPLCANVPALTNCWAGRPNWFFHHMGLGHTIGESARLSLNNGIVYKPANFQPTGVHVALMGDPTLRQHYSKRIDGLSVSPVSGLGASLSWTAISHPALAGYYVYRSDSAFGTYRLISPLLSNATFNDTAGSSGKKFYMVRPAFLQTSPSGTYYNLSLGTVDSANVTFPNSIAGPAMKPIHLAAWPNPGNGTLQLSVESPVSGEIRLSVCAANGREVSARRVRVTATGRQVLKLDTKALPGGIYIISVTDADGRLSTLRWIKMQ